MQSSPSYPSPQLFAGGFFCMFYTKSACALGFLFQGSKSHHTALTSFQNTNSINENLMIV